jgi:hypothetical protein
MIQLGNLSSYSYGVPYTVHLTSTERLPCARTLYLVNVFFLGQSEGPLTRLLGNHVHLTIEKPFE